VVAALSVADAVIVVIDATSGVEVQTERYWAWARERGLAAIAVVNKVDREQAEFGRCIEQLSKLPGCRPVPLYLPLGEGEQFEGLVDVMSRQALVYKQGSVSRQPLPAELEPMADEARGKLVEASAEADDELIDKYLEQGELSSEEVWRGLRLGTVSGKIVPLLAANATGCLGDDTLINAILALLPSAAERPAVAATNQKTGQAQMLEPSPEAPLAAFVFKTTADPYAGRLSFLRVWSGTLRSDSTVSNTGRQSRERIGQILVPKGKGQEAVPAVTAGDMGVVAKLHDALTGDTLSDEQQPVVLPGLSFPEPVHSLALHPKTRTDEDRMGQALHRITEEDPTIRVQTASQTRETTISGMGDLHLEVVAAKLKRKFNVELEMGRPKVPYLETFRKKASAQGKYKRQTGGRGQYGDVWVEYEPLPRGAGFEFVDKVVGGVVPKNYIAAVEKGIREAADRGVLARYPVVDIRARLYDGSHHPVDSSDMAFKISGSLSLQNAAAEADPVLLEPIMEVEVQIPEQFMGDIMGDLNSKRGKIMGIEPAGTTQVVRALVPLAEMFAYASQLRSMTGGRGSYTMKFDHYEEVPPHIAQPLVEQAQKEKEGQR
jgi:elongation factor G